MAVTEKNPRDGDSTFFFTMDYLLHGCGLCCTPRAIDAKPHAMDMKRSHRDCWRSRLGKVPIHANRMLHTYVCASTPAPRPSQNPLRDTFCIPQNTPFSLFFSSSSLSPLPSYSNLVDHSGILILLHMTKTQHSCVLLQVMSPSSM